MMFSELKPFQYFDHPEYPNLTFIKLKPVEIGGHIYNAQNTLPDDEELYECDDDEEVFLVKYYEV